MTLRNEKLLPLFAEVRQLLEAYEEAFVARRDKPGYHDLVMPVCADGDLRAQFGPELPATLKGK